MEILIAPSGGTDTCQIKGEEKTLSGAADIKIKAIEIVTQFKNTIDIVLKKKGGALYTYGSSSDVLTLRNATYLSVGDGSATIFVSPDEYCSIREIIHAVAEEFIVDERYPPE